MKELKQGLRTAKGDHEMTLANRIKGNPKQEAALASGVMILNVGGEIYTTTVSTLRKYPRSTLAELCSNPGKATIDQKGRIFIDREGTFFKYILAFLRSGQSPTHYIQEIYQEALFYNIEPLVELLKDSPALYGELVGRQQFLSEVPNYRENIEVVIQLARADSVGSRRSWVMACVIKNKEDEAKVLDAIDDLGPSKDTLVKFGPWRFSPTVSDLLDCIKLDIEKRGYNVSYQPYKAGRGLLSHSCNLFYELIFTWW
ncbi:BTB/POZ domain-containing protein KCTD14-like [Stegostoma tigrinum]|uniref:BTB/POZ domain-containing protein KCTD14-like n=1 Tax=Stegostoma tigrinum TaxID=3053191 RepID=UPI00286FBCD8|nr:BTB/POZ domain-containing protein KCTD14-like [Stegostoma tigrinum]